MSSTRQALEDYLATNPHDLAAHSAYADWLTENDDPRGEYIRLQLAIEDRNQPADRLRAMEQASFSLLLRYEQEWLGPFYPYVYSLEKRGYQAEPLESEADLTYRWGWIHQARIPFPQDSRWEAFAKCPLSRMVEILKITTSPYVHAAEQTDWIGQLNNFPLLRHLWVEWPYFADKSVHYLIASRLLSQLRGLDVSRCSIGDKGAWALAREPSVRELEYLRLEYNDISPLGAQALEEIGIQVGEQRQFPFRYNRARYEV